ncbi:hypothetical protein LINGRAHAP2_LOCUS17516 [Linum grandiflorum]
MINLYRRLLAVLKSKKANIFETAGKQNHRHLLLRFSDPAVDCFQLKINTSMASSIFNASSSSSSSSSSSFFLSSGVIVHFQNRQSNSFPVSSSQSKVYWGQWRDGCWKRSFLVREVGTMSNPRESWDEPTCCWCFQPHTDHTADEPHTSALETRLGSTSNPSAPGRT